MLDSVVVPRAETRRGNARGEDRHRLLSEQALLRHGKGEQAVELVNLSAGGAMIRGDLDLMLWDHVHLVLGERGDLECAVRWMRDDRAGLEFAHETRIDCNRADRDQLLRAVISKSFPDVEIALDPPTARAEGDPEADQRAADRHPLVWNGVIYYADTHDYEAEPVRLRNISIAGALVQSGNALAEGTTVYLDMRSAGRHAATVKWTCGDQSGLEFHEPFDIQLLANDKPEIASTGSTPSPEHGPQEPWAPGWQRSTISQLARRLAG